MPRGLFILLLLCITKNSSGILPPKQSNQLCRQVQKVCKKTFATSPTLAFTNWEHYCLKNKALVSMVPYNINYGIKIDSASSVLFNGKKVEIDKANFPLPYSANVQVSGNCIPDVMEQSGARLVDVGTTNRTRLRDYARAIDSRRNDVALVMKVHPSNFAIEGFTEDTSIAQLATLEVPVVADIGSGLLDNTAPWLHGFTEQVPSWITGEPAARQALADGAVLVTFSGDKLLGGPQCGIIAGRADLIDACASHPLMRALRPGGHTLTLLQSVLLSYSSKTACADVPFWKMVSMSQADLEARAAAIVSESGIGSVVQLDSLVGAGSAPGSTIASFGISLNGDHREALRRHSIPVIARTFDKVTYLDMRSVSAADDHIVVAALASLR